MRTPLIVTAVVMAGLVLGCRPKPKPGSSDPDVAPPALAGGAKAGSADGAARPRVARKAPAPPAGWQVVQDPQNEFSCWLPQGKVTTDQSRNRPLPTGERVDLRTFLTSATGPLYMVNVYTFLGADPDAPTSRADLDRDCDTFLKVETELLKVQMTSDVRTPVKVGGVDGLKVVLHKSRGPGEVIYLARSAGRLFRFHQTIPTPADADGPDAATFARGIEILIR